MSEVIKKHEHSIYDTDPHFKIDPISMAITTEAKKTTLIKGSHNCERFTFEMPKEIEGHDMSLCDKVEIHYLNIGSGADRVEDVHKVDDFQVSPESEDVLIFSWLLDGNTCKYAGTLSFAIVFKCTDGDIDTYKKPTDKFSGITVKDTINNSEAVVEEHSDILQQWYDKLFGEGIGGAVDDVQINGASIVGENGVAEIPALKRGKFGLPFVNSTDSDRETSGIDVDDRFGNIKVIPSPTYRIDTRATSTVITPTNLDYAVQSAMGAPIGDGMIDGVFHYPAWSKETQAAAIERIGLKDYIKYKYFNFIEAGVNVEGNPTYDEIKEAILSDVTPALIHGHYIAYMTSGHWDAEAFEREELPGFTFVTHRSDMNNHWKIKYTEFWCTKQDDGSTLWAVGTHYLDAFIAEYNVTPAEAVIDAYEKGLEIIVKRSATPDQPAHYARLVRADGYGVTPSLTFTCEENKLSHHYHINEDGWHYWCYNLEDYLNGLNSNVSSLENSVDSIAQYINGKDTLLSALSSMNTVDILKSVYSFRGGFCNNAGTMHIKNPGIYLIMQGGTGNKQITIKQPGTTALEAKWNGIILLAYEGGVVTPIGIESSLTIAGAFKMPGTFQGWTTDGSYSTTINYPEKCVVAYLGNSNVDYLA